MVCASCLPGPAILPGAFRLRASTVCVLLLSCTIACRTAEDCSLADISCTNSATFLYFLRARDPGICDVPYSWIHTRSNAAAVQNELRRVAQPGSSALASATFFGTVPNGGNDWSGGALAPNGKIYGMPYSQTGVLIIDPVARTVDTTTISGLSAAASKWSGAVLAPSGKIYGIPFNGPGFLKIDPETNTTSTVGASTGYAGGVVGPNGKIYAIPASAVPFLVLDPADDSIRTFGPSTGGYTGGVLGFNGKIYAIPNGSGNVAVIDPESEAVSVFGTASNHIGAAPGPDGNIYSANVAATNPIKIDTAASTVTTFGITTALNDFEGNTLAPNGKIYSVTRSSAFFRNRPRRSVATYLRRFGGQRLGGRHSGAGRENLRYSARGHFHRGDRPGRERPALSRDHAFSLPE